MYALVAHARRRAELDNCSHGAPRAGHCGRDVSLYHSVCSGAGRSFSALISAPWIGLNLNISTATFLALSTLLAATDSVTGYTVYHVSMRAPRAGQPVREGDV